MKKLLIYLALGVSWITASADTPLWMRDVQISPDGQQIVFCYKGDIYKVAVSGGEAVRLTTQDSYESNPIWSPDSKQIAFASDRNGGIDLFIMSADGGNAQRLTTHSGTEIPSAFTPDGQYVVFSANIQDPAQSALFPSTTMTEVYQVSTKGGRIKQVLGTPAEMICFNRKGNCFLYQDLKGSENEWRKHHTSSVTRDIWLYDVSKQKHINLTNRAGEDRNPVFSPDEQQVFFLSERNGGSFNVYVMPTDRPQEAKAVTSFRTHPVRFLSIASDGTLCYTYDGEIYTQKSNGGKPRKVKIELIRDDENIPTRINITRGATDATPSPDGKQLAFITRGEVFVTSTEYPTTKQITHTPEGEKGITFAPDNRTLVYASERNGNWGLYQAKISREDDPNFPNATLIEEEALIPSSDIERSCPQFSPDGKELAFIEDRNKLMVLNLQTKKIRQITDGSTWPSTEGKFNYSWSPDSQWFTLEYIANGHDPYTDIGIVKADGKEEIINLTQSGYFSTSPRWVLDGNAILFITDRYGMRSHASWGSQSDVMIVFLNQDAYDKFNLNKEDYELQKAFEAEQKKETAKEKKEKEIDKKDENKKDENKEKPDDKHINIELKNIEDRIVRLTPNSSKLASAILSKDGEKLYYLSSFEKGFDLWRITLRDKDIKLLHKLNSSWANMEMDKSGKNIFLLSSGNMQSMNTTNERLQSISYQATLKLDLYKEREYMFDHVCKQEAKRFYDTRMHGVNWKSITAAYRKFLPHINNNRDFAELLSEMLGELNVSHTGGRYRGGSSTEPTAELGLLYDWNYEGKGLRIEEIVDKGPFDRASTKVTSGTIIEKINGQEITEDNDLYALLNGLTNKKTLVSFLNPETKETWEEVVKPISISTLNDLLYQRWVKQRTDDVDKWSGGRLGYVHIKSMDDASFRNIYSDILGKYNDREGIVIDTRFNGGGRLHEDIEILFSGKKYFTQVIRGHEACDMPSRRWNKPSIMLQCEANYSNAHGTPWVYRHNELGKLVGAPVPGTMTSVQWETLQDPSLIIGIPIIGYRLPDGSYLENTQLEPDIKVLNAPETIIKGEDTQLKTAVDELLKELDKTESKAVSIKQA